MSGLKGRFSGLNYYGTVRNQIFITDFTETKQNFLIQTVDTGTKLFRYRHYSQKPKYSDTMVRPGGKVFQYRRYGQEPKYSGTDSTVRSQNIPVQTVRSGAKVFRYSREPNYSGTDGTVRSHTISVQTVRSGPILFRCRRYG
jgi:hypothetical protein